MLSGKLAQLWKVTMFNIWGFPKLGVPQMVGLCHGKSHLEMDDWGVSLFQETTIYIYINQLKMVISYSFLYVHQAW